MKLFNVARRAEVIQELGMTEEDFNGQEKTGTSQVGRLCEHEVWKSLS